MSKFISLSIFVIVTIALMYGLAWIFYATGDTWDEARFIVLFGLVAGILVRDVMGE